MCKTPIVYLLHSRALCDFGLCATSVLWENHGADTCITWGLSWGACALSASRRPVWSEGFVG